MLPVWGSVHRGKPLLSSRRAFSCSDSWLFDVFVFCFIGFGHRGGCVFCMQECAKATLSMKDCQMTDRTTQTEQMGPEVRHKENTGTFLTRSETQKCITLTLTLTHTLWKNAWINDVTHYLMELGYNKTFLYTMFFLQQFFNSGNTLYTQPHSPSFEMRFSHYTLICQTTVHFHVILGPS